MKIHSYLYLSVVSSFKRVRVTSSILYTSKLDILSLSIIQKQTLLWRHLITDVSLCNTTNSNPIYFPISTACYNSVFQSLKQPAKSGCNTMRPVYVNQKGKVWMCYCEYFNTLGKRRNWFGRNTFVNVEEILGFFQAKIFIPCHSLLRVFLRE